MVKYVIGLDFGTDSVRSVIVTVDSGKEVATAVSYYKRWGRGKYSDPSKNQFRHHPKDYMESFTEAIIETLKLSPLGTSENIIGIGIGTTGSTLAPVDEEGTILTLKDEFSEDPDAMFILWKDHTAVEEAELINKAARSWDGIDFTRFLGGVYSSEWFFSKILHTIRNNKKVADAAYSWVELADWIPAILTSNIKPAKIKRSRCAAGHKAMWHPSWKGLPPEKFLVKIDPLLKGLRERLYTDTYTSDKSAGKLSIYWADKLSLPPGIAVTVGAFDAHMGAVGAGIRQGSFVKIIGTSCCDIAVSDPETIGKKAVAGICGQVDGSVIPGLIGLEAGQSSFGDAYAWFKDILMWPINEIMDDKDLALNIEKDIIPALTEEAEKIRPKDTSIVALDWLNGRRTPYADQKLKGAIAGLSLGTTAPKIFRAIVEATAFGSKAIIDRFEEDGVTINEVIAIGGISQKSPFVMQILSDVLNIPVKVAESFQSVALGAAIFATVASGYYGTILEAQDKMASEIITTYKPNKENVKAYRKLYKLYVKLGVSIENLLRKN